MTIIKNILRIFLSLNPWMWNVLLKFDRRFFHFLPKGKIIKFHLRNQFFNNFFLLNTDFSIDRKLAFNGFYDIKTLFLLKKFLKPGMTFIDIGANIGSISFCARNIVGPQGMVICFEPGPQLASILSQAIKINKFANMEVRNFGCGEMESLLYWKWDNSNPGNAILSNEPTDFAVKVVKLDDLFFDRKIDFIKIDVEGMEFQVLKGALNYLRTYSPMILIETNMDNECQKRNTFESLNFLQSLNYSFFAVENAIDTLSLAFDGNVDIFPVSYPILPQNVLALKNVVIPESVC